MLCTRQVGENVPRPRKCCDSHLNLQFELSYLVCTRCFSRPSNHQMTHSTRPAVNAEADNAVSPSHIVATHGLPATRRRPYEPPVASADEAREADPPLRPRSTSLGPLVFRELARSGRPLEFQLARNRGVNSANDPEFPDKTRIDRICSQTRTRSHSAVLRLAVPGAHCAVH